MKIGQLYILILSLIMMFVAAEKNSPKQTHNDISICQLIETGESINDIVSSYAISVENALFTINYFQPVHKQLCENLYYRKTVLSALNTSFLKLYGFEKMNLKPVRQRLCAVRLFYPPDKPDLPLLFS